MANVEKNEKKIKKNVLLQAEKFNKKRKSYCTKYSS